MSREKLKKLSKLHAIATGAVFGVYIIFSVIYSPEFLLSDIRDKFNVLADDTVTVTARVLAPPVKPLVTGASACNAGSLSISVDWPDDVNSTSYDVYRDGLPLVTGLSSSLFSDMNVVVNTSYDYVVVANGSMGPGTASSDAVTVTTPEKCVVIAPPANVVISAIQSNDLTGINGIPETTSRQPIFSGTTNIPNGRIDILLNSMLAISAQTSANGNGYWNWQVPVILPIDTHTLFVTVTDPNDATRTSTAILTFKVVNERKSSTGGGGKKISASTTASSGSQNGTEKPFTVPFNVVLSAGGDQVYPGKELPVSLLFSSVADGYDGVDIIIKYFILDEEGNVKSTLLAGAMLNEGRMITGAVPVPASVKDGKYRVKAEVILGRFDVSREAAFRVLPLPMIDMGGGFIVTYPELLSRLGWIVLSSAILLLLWLALFYREYWTYLHSLRHITERNLARSGFFGSGKGVSS